MLNISNNTSFILYLKYEFVKLKAMNIHTLFNSEHIRQYSNEDRYTV